jgi:hypothetical protein
MAPINFAGKLPVGVLLQWKSDVNPNALSSSKTDFRFVTANDFVSAFKISVGGATPITLTRKASAKNRMFDDSLNLFVTDPASGPALDDLIAAGRTVPCTIDLTFTFLEFFDVLLQQMTRTDADLHNLANPNDSKAILSTFVHSAAGGNISITYKRSKAHQLKDLPCKFVDFSVSRPDPKKPPGVKLVFELDFFSPPSDVNREAMRKLIAMDWSKLAKFGKDPGPGKSFPLNVESWANNRDFYVLNHTDMDRAEKIRQAIVGRHKAKTSKDLSKDLRDDIDLHLVTANHWGQKREDPVTERHQLLLSDLFGSLHQSVWLASPVNCLRFLDEKFKPTANQYAAMALQFGVGHCGEHASVSFTILSDIISSTGSLVKRAIKTGNANIDHAFVVYDLDIDTATDTLTTNPKNTRATRDGSVGAGGFLSVWNLKEAIAANTRPGFVMDPYLDKKVMKATAQELLDALNRADRVKQKKDTDFLAFDGIFPEPRPFTVLDLTTRSEEERKRRVKNV